MGYLLAVIFLVGWIYHWRKAKKLRGQLDIKDKQIAHLFRSSVIPPLEEDIAVLPQPAIAAIEAKPVEAKIEVVEQPNQDRIAEMERTIRRLENKTNSKFQNWFNENCRPVLVDANFQIEYRDFEGVVSERIITPKEICYQPQQKVYYISAFCHSRKEDRTFRSDNIISARNLDTNREIKELGKYLLKTQYY
ncbi:WYL domain-containing protein [Bartonella sp. HY329]|uniref:WYL domain-containing protein n=1 Tax=unclassified Bartonella TaxID=2645622 RepID=UPI0021C675B1|nr:MULTISPECIES: WYL domain-containing protein [unclassified Bartonella]UXM94339.1 WYL domain-containing protein [Bartonella sp. HY329]UXN08662.1 WYL domain-containing protein [Bartonella sp. HY328]